MPDPQAYSLDSAANALSVVELLRTRRSLSVTDVSRELGVGKSTAHRLLSTLIAEGYALRDPVQRKYYAGRALVEMGLSAIPDLSQPASAHNALVDLARETGETVKLMVLDGPLARVIDIALADHGRVGGAVGQALPAYAMAGGKVLLSHEGPEDVRRRYGGRLDPLTAQTITSWDALDGELAAVRERGWAANDSEATPGVAGLAVPVYGRDGQVVAALAIAAPASHLTADERMRMLRLMFATAFALGGDAKAD